MKKLSFLLVLPLFLAGCSSSDPLSSVPAEQAIVTVLNTVIQSPEVQQAEFYVESGCTASNLNNIMLCSAVEVKDDYSYKGLDQACVDVCNAAKSAAYEVCDDTRKTCKTGCDAIEASYEACKIACCYGCIWGKTCSCESLKNDYNDCNNSCDNMSSDCKSGADKVFDDCKNGCYTLTITGGYDMRVEWIKGVGSMLVDSVYNMVPMDTTGTIFGVDLALHVPTVSTLIYYKIWQDPIPAQIGEIPLSAQNTLVFGKGRLYVDCSEDHNGYYLEITELEFDIPDNVFDSNELTQLAQELGMDVKELTGGAVDLNKELLAFLDDFLAAKTMSILNDILKDTKIADADCL